MLQFVKFIVDKFYLPDYIALVFLDLSSKGREQMSPGLFFEFYSKGGDYNGLYND